MKLKRCPNSHYYDGDKYEQCPHCSAVKAPAPAPKPVIEPAPQPKTDEPAAEKKPVTVPAAKPEPIKKIKHSISLLYLKPPRELPSKQEEQITTP